MAIAFLLVGIVGYISLPVASLPNVDFPTVQISASLPGASPETMASNVATPLERQFSLIPGITQMTSVNSFGSTSITLQFELGQDINGVFEQVQAAISAASAQLPSNLPAQPTIRLMSSTTTPTSFFRNRSRASMASAWSISAASRSRPCASALIRARSPPVACRSTPSEGR